MVAIANFDMAVLFAVEFDNDDETTQLLIVCYMYKLADLPSSLRFQWYLSNYSRSTFLMRSWSNYKQSSRASPMSC